MELFTYFLEALIHTEHRKRQAHALNQRTIRSIEKKLEYARRSGNEVNETQLLIQLGDVYASTSDFEKADISYKQALDLAHYREYRPMEIVVLLHHGTAYKARLEYANASHCYQEALAIVRELGDCEVEKQINQLIDELHNMLKFDELSKQQR